MKQTEKLQAFSFYEIVDAAGLHNITFNDVPQILTLIVASLEKIEKRLCMVEIAADVQKRWMSIEEFSAYHPGHPAIDTVYDWVRLGKVPSYKCNGRILFERSEVDRYLMSNARVPKEWIKRKAEEDVNAILSKKNGAKQ